MLSWNYGEMLWRPRVSFDYIKIEHVEFKFNQQRSEYDGIVRIEHEEVNNTESFRDLGSTL